MEPSTTSALEALIKAAKERPVAAAILDEIQEVVDELGLHDDRAQLVVSEYTQEAADRARRDEPGARAEWLEWTAGMERACGVDVALDRVLADAIRPILDGAGGQDLARVVGTRLRRAEVRRLLTPVEIPPVIEDFTRELLDTHDELRELAAESIDEHGRVALPHLFMADVARHVLAEHDRGGERAERAHEILARVDDALGTHEDLDNVLALGFVEGFPEQAEPRPDLTAHFGPALGAEARRFAPDLFA